MGKYDNNTVEQDSSEGYVQEGMLVLYWGGDDDPRCKCGCLDSRASGDFRQGHDARLKGKLNRAHARDQKLLIIENGASSTTTPMEYAETRNWGRFLEKAKVTAERAADRATVRASRKSVGKQANPGGGSLEKLELMKACSRVLKAIGRYEGPDKIDIGSLDSLERTALAEGTYEPIAKAVKRDKKSKLFVGQTVRIDRQGHWQQAEVLEVKGDRCRILQITMGTPEEWVVGVDSVWPVVWGG